MPTLTTTLVGSFRRAFPALAGLVAATAGFAQVQFHGVGFVAGGNFTEVRDATKTAGEILAVGQATGSSGAGVAFRWSSATGTAAALPDLFPANPSTIPLIASAITRDGSVIASRMHNAPGGSNRVAVLVTNSGTTNTVLGTFPGSPLYTAATSVSEDGSVAYGLGRYDGSGNLRSFRWTAATGVVAVPFLAPGDFSSVPAGRGCSADGSILVGSSGTNPGGFGPGTRGFRYQYGVGMMAMPLPPGGTWNVALAVSPDGNRVLGVGDVAGLPNGSLLLWDLTANSFGSLGTPDPRMTPSSFGGLTADGTAAVISWGRPVNADFGTAYVWNSHGWVSLQLALQQAGVNLAGWQLNTVFGVSPDGTLVFGGGLHNGLSEGWVAEVPAGFLASVQAPTAAFYGVGDLPGGAVFSEIRDATVVGGIVHAVGSSSNHITSSGTGDTGILWTPLSGLTPLPDVVPNTTSLVFVTASAITRDAVTIAARSHAIASGNNRVAVLVTDEGTTNTVLGPIPTGLSSYSAANAVSEDGSVAYGFSFTTGSGLGNQPFRWTAATGLVGVPFVHPTAASRGLLSAGRGTSFDGSVMVGTETSEDAPFGFAVRYVDGVGTSALPLLAGGTWSNALAVSPNGSLALSSGDSTAAPQGELMIWNAATGTNTPLGSPDVAFTPSNFGGFTADGAVAVMSFGNGTASVSYLRNSQGWIPVEEPLLSLGLDLTGWTLNVVFGISPDGRVVFGNGMHNGNTEGWVALVPPGYLAAYAPTPAAPVIVTQPADTSVVSGNPASFTVVATGVPNPTYQWRKGGVDIVGATSATLTIPNAQPADVGNYKVVVTNASGKAVSTAAHLTVLIEITITEQPASVSVVAGKNTTLKVTATGTKPLTYQWRKDGIAIAGATARTLQLADTTPADAGSYDVVITNDAGSVISDPAVVTVIVKVAIVTDPTDQTVVAGQPATFSVTASGTGPLSYQWKKAGVDIPGATAATYTIANAQDADVGNYKVTVTSAAGSATSAAAHLAVIQPVAITTQPADVTVRAGRNTTLKVTATGTSPLTYQWRKGGVAISGATDRTLQLTSVTAADAGSYDVVVSNAAGSLPSNAATVTVQ